MPLLLATNLAKTYGAAVLTDASLALERGEKVALVGRNGAGKTTLLRILAGLEFPDAGTRTLSGGATVGYLAQDPEVDETQTLWEAAAAPFSRLAGIERRLAVLEAELASPDVHGDEARLAAALDQYGRLREQFETQGGFTYEAEVRRTLTGLEFTEPQFGQRLASMSGGQRARAALARLLLGRPDLLLLDEPTNHLDLDGQEWLETFLTDYGGAILLVSHDRTLLDAVTSRTLELDEGRLEEYPGNYSYYVVERIERHARQQEAFERQQEEIETLKAYVRRYHAGQKSRQAKSREKRLAKIDALTAPRTYRTASIRLEAPRRNPQVVLRLRGVVKRFGEQNVLRGVSFEVRRGEKIGLIGPNGVGKTTLLRLIAGQEPPTAGAVEPAPGMRIGYFAQHSEDALDLEQSVLDEVLGARPVTPAQVRSLLGRFLFSGDDVYRKIRQLSGGERRRVALAKLVLDRPDVLLLDEPTTHLDLITLEALEAALRAFPGAMLFVSHDRYLLDRIAGRLLLLGDGTVQFIAGPYHKYRESLKDGTASSAQPSPVSAAPVRGQENRAARPSGLPDPTGTPPAERKPAKAKRPRDLERSPGGDADAQEELVRKIAALEEEMKDLSRRMGDPELYRDAARARETVRRYEEATAALEALYAALESAG